MVADEGNGAGSSETGKSYEDCESLCQSRSGCNSFAHCENNGDCYTKDKVLHGFEPIRTTSKDDCTTYYKSNDGKWIDCSFTFLFWVFWEKDNFWWHIDPTKVLIYSKTIQKVIG